jgi:hypothetical protein
MSYNPYPFAAKLPTGLVYGVPPVLYVGWLSFTDPLVSYA